jgi:hypothetical protein
MNIFFFFRASLYTALNGAVGLSWEHKRWYHLNIAKIYMGCGHHHTWRRDTCNQLSDFNSLKSDIFFNFDCADVFAALRGVVGHT